MVHSGVKKIMTRQRRRTTWVCPSLWSAVSTGTLATARGRDHAGCALWWLDTTSTAPPYVAQPAGSDLLFVCIRLQWKQAGQLGRRGSPIERKATFLIVKYQKAIGSDTSVAVSSMQYQPVVNTPSLPELRGQSSGGADALGWRQGFALDKQPCKGRQPFT